MRKREAVSVRIDPPIVGLPVNVRVLCRGPKQELLRSEEVDIKFTWSVTKERVVCTDVQCAQQHKYEPMPGKFALSEEPLKGQLFCSDRCAQRSLSLKPRVLSRPIPDDDPDAAEEAMWAQTTDMAQRSAALDTREISNESELVPDVSMGSHGLAARCEVRRKGTGELIGTGTSVQRIVLVPPPEQDPPMMCRAEEGRSETLRVTSYNILAEIYTTMRMYPYCPLPFLQWSFRGPRLLQELLQTRADVLCLQEVQGDHFQRMMLPALKRHGFDALFEGKTRDAGGVEGRMDGCATLYRRSRLRLVRHEKVRFDDMIDHRRRQMGRGEPKDMARRLKRGNVAILATFEGVDKPLGSRNRVVVGNTHVFWDPEYADVKLWQTQMLAQRLEQYLGPGGGPVILCGDFNSTPDSAVYSLLTEGQVPREHKDLQHDPKNIVASMTHLRHGLGLASSYKVVTGKEPEYTNLTESYKGTLDYILHNMGVQPVNTARIPIPLKGPFPCPEHSSDHLPLITDFRVL